MAVPKYDEMMLPVLRILGDGAEHPQRELADQVADYFKLTPQERAERLPKVKATYSARRIREIFALPPEKKMKNGLLPETLAEIERAAKLL